MKFFPESTLVQLEYEKVKVLLSNHCKTEFGKAKCAALRIHTKKEFIETELRQTNEYKLITQSGQVFPNDFVANIAKELKLLSIQGAVLSGEQFLLIKRLTQNTNNIFRWFDAEKRQAYGALAKVINDTYYEKAIPQLIDEVLDEIEKLPGFQEYLKEIRGDELTFGDY